MTPPNIEPTEREVIPAWTTKSFWLTAVNVVGLLWIAIDKAVTYWGFNFPDWTLTGREVSFVESVMPLVIILSMAWAYIRRMQPELNLTFWKRKG